MGSCKRELLQVLVSVQEFLLGPLLFVDFCAGADPDGDVAVVAAQGESSAEMPTVVAVGATDAMCVFERLTRCDGILPKP